MKAPISVCMITRGEPTLEAAIASVRPYVEQVCILYTGDDVWWSPETRAIGDVVKHLAWRDDFSAARNASFALATQPYVLWLDSDDILIGAENLAAACRVTAGLERVRMLARYEYRHDPGSGACTLLQWRERIVKNPSAYHWERPVHETLVAKDGRNEDLRLETVTWIHQRKDGRDASERNMRILRAHVAKHGLVDARIRYDLACELHNAGERDEAIEHLTHYLDESGRDDERALACIRLGQLHGGPADLESAMRWAKRALEYEPGYFDAKLMLARLHLARGLMLGATTDLDAAVSWALDAREMPDSIVPTNPADRTLGVAETLHHAYAALGDVVSASAALDGIDHPRARLMASQVVPRAYAGLDVAFVCGPTPEPWNPRSVAARGIGGSETAVVEVARRLAAKGHRVRVFTACGAEGLYDGVEYRETPLVFDVDNLDVLVAWRNAQMLELAPARTKILWAHDLKIDRASPWRLSLADRVLAVSEWHRKHLLDVHADVGLRECGVMRNGVDFARFAWADFRAWLGPNGGRDASSAMRRDRNPYRAIYSSSWDRGLNVLLDLWPRIRAEVPDAELRVFYGRTAAPEWLYEKFVDIERRMAELPGVVNRGRVNQRELAREMLGAGVWLHPAWHITGQPWLETSCIGAIEAQAAGLRIVCGAHGALPETVKTGRLVEGDATSAEWRDEFASSVVKALRPTRDVVESWLAQFGPVDDEERPAIAAAVRGVYDWDAITKEWDSMIREMVARTEAAA